MTVERNALADDVCIGTEVTPPQPVAQDNYGRRANRTIVFRQKTSPHRGAYLKHVKVIAGYKLAVDTLRLTINGQVHRALRVSRES